MGQLHEESDQVIYKTLTSIKGIGPWTAKVVLIHGYCRDDIAIKEDLVLRKSLEKHFGKEKDFDQVMNEFKPHRSLASIVLWEVN